MKKGFTLIEVIVAIAILAMMLGFAGVIFNISINSHRTVGASTEIMQTFRAITSQLKMDFAGIRNNAPLAIRFQQTTEGKRYDSIAFFANGDFQSVRQYWHIEPDGELDPCSVFGNLASIYYGPAVDPNILARKYKIFTSDPCFVETSSLADNKEFLIGSLAAWKINLDNITFRDWISPPVVDPYMPEDIPLYMTGDLGSFMVQIGTVRTVDSEAIIEWFPKTVDDIFGFFYNIPQNINLVAWSDQSENWPQAVKFTFRLYDSKRLIKNGRLFTYIVYIGD